MHDFEFFGFVATGHRATLVGLGSGATIERSSGAPDLLLYNTERPHLGYRNMGRCPIETVIQFSGNMSA